MKNERKRDFSRFGEYAVMAALLTVYGLVIFLSPDPEWVVWAGQMSVGVIDPSAVPPTMAGGAVVDSLHTASTLSMLGVLAVAVLLATAVGLRPGRESRPAGHTVAGGNPAGRGSGPHA